MKIQHPFSPLYDKDSKILILGSFPSVKSREQMFFYGHPQNRFWRVLAAVFNSVTPCTINEKESFCHKNHIALWDVIASCEIVGSADSSIKDVVPNDLSIILNNAKIEKIFVNGKTAEKVYNKYIFPHNGKKARLLPSTSPANAVWSVERLTEEWNRAINEI